MIDRLRRATERAGGPALSDGELLSRFIAARDEEAFAGIVRRHGPLVLAVCRRVAANPEVADDAFQAVFMVLAKKADSVRPREAVRGWLYGVATRTALRARTMTGRREKRETLVGTVPDQPSSTRPDTDPDALRILDEEIGRLPEQLRAAVVLCELDGVGRKEAATRLRVPEGTLSSRLAKARKLLATRLRGRGVASIAACFSALAGSSTVSAELTNRTARAAMGSQTPSAAASILSREVMRTMFLSKLKHATGLLIGLAIAAAAFAMNPANPTAEAAPSPAYRPVVTSYTIAPVPVAPPRESVLMMWIDGAPVILTPEGKVTNRPDPSEWHGDKWGGTSLTLGRLSPDGKRVLFNEVTAGSAGESAVKCRQIIRSLNGNEKPIEVLTDLRGPSALWSRDGKRVYAFGHDPEKHDKREPQQLGVYEVENWVVDLATGKKSKVLVPSSCAIKDESPDGKRFLTAESELVKKDDGTFHYAARIYITTPGENPDHHQLAPELGDLCGLSFSPDGSKVLAIRPIPGLNLGFYDLLVIDVKTGKAIQLNKTPEEQGIYSACWSPDGKKVAYAWWEANAMAQVAPAGPVPTPQVAGPGVAAPTPAIDTHITLVDADGKNRKQIHKEEGKRVYMIDWR